jgi:hypothetical protein
VFHSNFPEAQELKYLIVYDEVHRLLPKFGGSGEGFIQIERACREFRKWGIGVMLISQVLADFVGQIKANINTEIQMRTRDEGDLKRIETKYGKGLLRSLVKASVGTGMVENSAYNKGKPYFVSFRPILHSIRRLSDEELAKYNKYNEIIDDFEYQLEQLEELDIDAFDMKLELKLALDKVKAGSFNMVDIYLESLESRLKSEWDKIGKKPKKRKTELIEEDVLKDELQRAKKEREEYVVNQKTVEEKSEKQQLLFDMVFEPLTFDNGAMVSSLAELISALQSMDEQIFESHVNDKRNDVYDWIKNTVGDRKLAEMVKVSSKEEIIDSITKNKKRKYKVETKNTGPINLEDLTAKANRLLKENKRGEALHVYRQLQKIYMLLPKNQKNQYYPKLVKLFKKLKT